MLIPVVSAALNIFLISIFGYLWLKRKRRRKYKSFFAIMTNNSCMKHVDDVIFYIFMFKDSEEGMEPRVTV